MRESKYLSLTLPGSTEEALKDLLDMPEIERSEENVKVTGNHSEIREQIIGQIQKLLEDENQFISILNAREFGNYSLARVTRYVSEVTLNFLRDEFSSKARLCLVLEEAHSLVPEWNSVVEKSEQNDTIGTARAIMQGRKHGFGCLLITQRSANVTKSILNQCNTMFALQIFDDTGKEFLQNYFGVEYARMLPALPSYHCVAYGRGLNANTPALIKLNDPEEFRANFGSPVNPIGSDDS